MRYAARMHKRLNCDAFPKWCSTKLKQAHPIQENPTTSPITNNKQTAMEWVPCVNLVPFVGCLTWAFSEFSCRIVVLNGLDILSWLTILTAFESPGNSS